MAHARRKFFDLHSQQQSLIAGEALAYFGKLYGVEREVVELNADERRRIREAEVRGFISVEIAFATVNQH